MLKIQTDKILQAQMDRRAFLKNTGIAFVGLVGVTTVVKQLNLLGDLGGVTPTGRKVASQLGYGSATYGGAKRTFNT